jgi:hypothetical protein
MSLVGGVSQLPACRRGVSATCLWARCLSCLPGGGVSLLPALGWVPQPPVRERDVSTALLWAGCLRYLPGGGVSHLSACGWNVSAGRLWAGPLSYLPEGECFSCLPVSWVSQLPAYGQGVLAAPL